MENETIYLYLARRDKKEIKILTKMKGKCDYKRNLDIKELKLPINWAEKIQAIVYENRMHWEVCMESSATFEQFRGNLKNKGFKILPSSPLPLISLTAIPPNDTLDKNIYQGNALPKIDPNILKALSCKKCKKH